MGDSMAAASNSVRPINQFGVHEITTEVFRDNLARTVDNLTRVVGSQVFSIYLIFYHFSVLLNVSCLSQASEIKALRAELDLLNKAKSRQKIQREQEKSCFQWLLEQISDDDDAKDFPMPGPPSKKRKRPIGKKQAGGAWISDAEFEDECDDDDGALTDDMVLFPPPTDSFPPALTI